MDKIEIHLNVSESQNKLDKQETIKEWIEFFTNIQQEHSLGNALIELNINI
ncbi:hypothetical protein [Peptoniphilus indolicus]|uniref:Uncharacterized protein n=2 Tax=Peptoniphilus indolicus TaxID=33030 RepID=G4D5K2_9FIRM|nr:hypothetical protein [Peptoniphilus indolicus]EGY78668.1 hypothetical protein HMPREF9129_1682 [Peptoniphilus indolicus ATCC 29427]SUB74421.1 Uncharacterised protein [Peptoniphilus indolicus]